MKKHYYGESVTYTATDIPVLSESDYIIKWTFGYNDVMYGREVSYAWYNIGVQKYTLEITTIATGLTTVSSGYVDILFDTYNPASGSSILVLKYGNYTLTITAPVLTANRLWNYPDTDGTHASREWVTQYYQPLIPNGVGWEHMDASGNRIWSTPTYKDVKAIPALNGSGDEIYDGSGNQIFGENPLGTGKQWKNIIGTVNQVYITFVDNNITISAAQDIGIYSSPTFTELTLSNSLHLAALNSPPTTPTSGQTLYGYSGGLSWIGTNGYTRTFNAGGITANHIWELPNVDGKVITTGNLTDITGNVGQLGVPNVSITPTNGTGFVDFAPQSVKPDAPLLNHTKHYTDISGHFCWMGSNGYVRSFDGTANTADHTYTLPNYDGTIITTGNLSGITSVGTLSSLNVTNATTTGSVIINGTAGVGYIELQPQTLVPTIPAANTIRMFTDASGRYSWKGANGYVCTFDGTANTADRVYTLPNNSGAIISNGQAATTIPSGASVPSAGSITATYARPDHVHQPNTPTLYCYAASSDFLSGSSANNMPWTGQSRNSGTSAVMSTGSIANHPGLVTLVSHTSNANSGYYWTTNSSMFIIGGGENSTCVFSPTVTTGQVLLFGFLSSSFADATQTNAIMFSLTGATLSGKTINGSNTTVTGTTYTMTAGAYYRLNISVNSDASLVTFSCYTCADQALVWSDTCSTNIPVGFAATHGVSGVVTSPSGATQLAIIDYMDLHINKALVR